MTAAAPKRTYITQVHRSLAEKIGNEGADTLTNYLEDVIPAQIEDKIQYLATKEDVANVALKISGGISTVKSEIADVKADLKQDIANVKSQVANIRADLKEDVAKVEQKLSGDIANIKAEVAKVELKLSGGIANVRADLKQDIAKVEAQIQHLATKEDVANVKAQVANVKAEVANVRTEVADVRTEVATVRGELKEDIVRGEARLTELILNTQLKMEQSLKGQIKWVLATMITIALGALFLYVKNK